MDRQQFVRLCDCGCGQPTRLAPQNHTRMGWIKGQPLRWINNHKHVSRRPIADRFWEKVNKQSGHWWQNTECWFWVGGKSEGYGNFCIEKGRHQTAHHIAYELLIGPIPVGMVPDHLCRNRACVNPAHMEIVTDLENIMRGESPPARNARKTECDKGHAYTLENTIVYKNGTRACRQCKQEYMREYEQRRVR